MTDRQRRRGKERLLSAIIVVASIIVTLVGIEIYTRTVVDDGMNFDLEMWKYAREIKRESPIEGVGHDHRPNSESYLMGAEVEINSMGLRDREYSLEKPAGVTRIMMLGDSLTFGWGVAEKDTVSTLLESRLNEGLERPAYEVINGGVGNYNSSMEILSFLEREAVLKPDIVVLNYFINDAEPTPHRTNSALLEHSYAAVYIMSRIDILERTYFGKSDWRDYYSGLYDEDAAGWRQNREAIRRLDAYCDAHGIRLMIVNYPELHQLRDYPFTAVTDKIAALAGELDAPFLDLLPALRDFEPESLWVSPTDAHPNAKANTAIAATMETALRRAYPAEMAR
jgi:lysophospholipase L1-like esterase